MSKINFAMFMAGLTIGSAATWLCLKKRYEQIAQEEIDSVKAVFAEKKPETVIRKEENENIDKDNKIKADQAKLKPDLINYAAKLAEEGYTNYASTNNKNAKEEKVNKALYYLARGIRRFRRVYQAQSDLLFGRGSGG